MPNLFKGKNSVTLIILSLIMVVNALSYGIIIPLLYPYATKFGIGPLQLSLMFSSFSFFQLIATPVIGRLSDVYGRKPLLLLSLLGTSFSLALFASATTISMLFFARILDGITGGNVSVAQAMMADTTSGKDRAKAFGLLGAAFGFGFLFGPAIGGLLSGWHLTAPFWFASGLAFVGTIAGVIFLPETNRLSKKQKQTNTPVINPISIAKAFFVPSVGIILWLNLIGTTAHQAFVLGFQTFSVDVLSMSPQQIGLLFALLGTVSVIMQMGGIGWLIKKVGSQKRVLVFSYLLTSIVVLAAWNWQAIGIFIVLSMLYGAFFAPQSVIIPAMISQRTKKEDQGGILGINQSVMSLGQILGPLLAGLVSWQTNVPTVFIVASGIFGLAFVVGIFGLGRVLQRFDLR